jgi:hypothetical protein
VTGAEIIALVSATAAALPAITAGIRTAIDDFKSHRQTLLEIPSGTSTWRATYDAAIAEHAKRAAAKEKS